MVIYRPKLCECGCGQEVKNKFVRGHNGKFKGRHHSIEARMKISKSSMGKIISKEQREKIARTLTGIKQSEETKRKRSVTLKGIIIPDGQRKRMIEGTRKTLSERSMPISQREKLSRAHKLLWNNLEYREKQTKKIMAGLCLLPNKPEMRLNEILNGLYPGEWKYVGDGQFFIAGRCPDFVNINGQKKIIELFGDYWHKDDDPQDRIGIFKPFGFETLVIWEHELKSLKKLKRKLLDFTK